MPIRSHRDLLVWQKAMDVVEGVYHLSETLPRTETYRLVDQMCRAAVSIPANIAEGYGRGTSGDYSRFLAIARGSASETEIHLMLAIRLGYLTQQQAEGVMELLTEVSKMLTTLRSRIRD
jgi:four helix bundle protein